MHVYYLFCLLVILLLPGCKQYLFWGKQNFIQAPKIRVDLTQARFYLQTKRVYDEASTVGIFDALWLNHTVRKAYVNLYAARKGLFEQDKQDLIEQHKKELDDSLSFYILMNNDEEHALNPKVQESRWSVYLIINNQRYSPSSLKPVLLTPEYVKIFGHRYSQFRAPYLVKFHATDMDDADLLNMASSIELHISSVNHTVQFRWTKEQVISACSR